MISDVAAVFVVVVGGGGGGAAAAAAAVFGSSGMFTVSYEGEREL